MIIVQSGTKSKLLGMVGHVPCPGLALGEPCALEKEAVAVEMRSEVLSLPLFEPLS